MKQTEDRGKHRKHKGEHRKNGGGEETEEKNGKTKENERKHKTYENSEIEGERGARNRDHECLNFLAQPSEKTKLLTTYHLFFMTHRAYYLLCIK